MGRKTMPARSGGRAPLVRMIAWLVVAATLISVGGVLEPTPAQAVPVRQALPFPVPPAIPEFDRSFYLSLIHISEPTRPY